MSNVITFQRQGRTDWEHAYTEDHLKLKLGNDKASKVIRPKKSLFHVFFTLWQVFKR